MSKQTWKERLAAKVAGAESAEPAEAEAVPVKPIDPSKRRMFGPSFRSINFGEAGDKSVNYEPDAEGWFLIPVALVPLAKRAGLTE